MTELVEGFLRKDAKMFAKPEVFYPLVLGIAFAALRAPTNDRVKGVYREIASTIDAFPLGDLDLMLEGLENAMDEVRGRGAS